MNRYGKRCVLYPRVSTEMQVDGYSLEGQKNMLTRFADREEMIVVDTYEDAGKSGKSIEGRPAFQKMLRDIEDAALDLSTIRIFRLVIFALILKSTFYHKYPPGCQMICSWNTASQSRPGVVRKISTLPVSKKIF